MTLDVFSGSSILCILLLFKAFVLLDAFITYIKTLIYKQNSDNPFASRLSRFDHGGLKLGCRDRREHNAK